MDRKKKIMIKNKKKTKTTMNQTIAFVVAGVLLASFMGTMGMMSQQAALAQTGEINSVRMIWHSARCFNEATCNDLRDMTNRVLESGDQLVFHYGLGQDPQPYQIAAMQGVTAVTNANKGFEFFSLAEMEEHAPTLDSAFNGAGFLSYDLEGSIGNGPSPDAELQDPVTAFEDAKAIALAHTLGIRAAPSHAISSNNGHLQGISEIVGRYHLQSQPKQDDDATCSIMETWIDGRVSAIEAVRSGLEGKITFQVTLTGNAASGKTPFDTAKDCIDAVLPNDVDGVSIWFGGAQYDDGSLETLLEYLQNTY